MTEDKSKDNDSINNDSDEEIEELLQSEGAEDRDSEDLKACGE